MALKDLKDYFEASELEDVKQLLSQKCIVTEKIQASSFYTHRNNGVMEFFKSGKNEPINKIDRTIVSYYEKAVKHFNALLPEKVQQLPHDWKFGFDYMTSNKTVSVEYDNVPKNNLILTHIQVLQEDGRVKKVIKDPKILNKWATILEVDEPTIIFNGKLAEYQVEKLINMLALNIDEATKFFSDFSFTHRIFKVFNESIHNSKLHNDLSKDIDGLIVTFQDGSTVKNFKIQSPLKESRKEDRSSSDAYQITVLRLIEYFNKFDFGKIKLEGEKTDERYLEIMSAGFNSFLKEHRDSFLGIDFKSADFAKEKEFELNPIFLNNQETIKNINDSKQVAELLKITLGTFRKLRDKETTLLSGEILESLNNIVKSIKSKVFGEVEESEIMDFQTFKINDTLKSQKSPINEGLKVDYIERGAKKVNMFVGRFQPFTLGHTKVLENLYEQNGLNTVVVLVKSKTKKKDDAQRRPFTTETQMQLLEMAKADQKIEGVIVVETAGIDKIFNQLRPKYEPVLWGSGTDRMKGYGYQVDNVKYREQLNVLEEFSLFEIQRDEENVSATKVREAIINENEEEFKQLTPPSIHSMFYELQLELSKVQQKETVLTFNEFKTK
jgi:cytidyltransferase-like protein